MLTVEELPKTSSTRTFNILLKFLDGANLACWRTRHKQAHRNYLYGRQDRRSRWPYIIRNEAVPALPAWSFPYAPLRYLAVTGNRAHSFIRQRDEMPIELLVTVSEHNGNVEPHASRHFLHIGTSEETRGWYLLTLGCYYL
jgi:hypothetical protein